MIGELDMHKNIYTVVNIHTNAIIVILKIHYKIVGLKIIKNYSYKCPLLLLIITTSHRVYKCQPANTVDQNAKGHTIIIAPCIHLFILTYY